MTKVEQLERDFLKKAKEVDSLKDEQVTTEEKLDKLPRTAKRDKRFVLCICFINTCIIHHFC